MSPSVKTRLKAVLLILTASALNWSNQHDYLRTHGTTSEGLKLQPLAYLIVTVCLVFLLHKAAKLVDYLRFNRISIPRRWSMFMDWRIFVACLPLLFTSHRLTSGTLEDGTNYTKQFNYGDEHSPLLYFLVIVVIGLFRFVIEVHALQSSTKQAEQVTTPNP